jgi:hypothetical protein
MTPSRELEPEVHEAGLGWMERKPIPRSPLLQRTRKKLAGSATAGTIRLKLLKHGALVAVRVRRIRTAIA